MKGNKKNSPDESVDLDHTDFVEFPDCARDVMLVRLGVHDEGQSVVVFDLLHRRFRCHRILDDPEFVQAGEMGCALPLVLRIPAQLESLRAVEVDGFPDLAHEL